MTNAGEAKGGSDPGDDVDARTVFVRNLPFTLTDAQLENVFSEVGPVRHCFTVKEKGSDQHRGFGFVQFAVTEDAHLAVQDKNGALLESRKIKVEVAKRRAPLDIRHPKSTSLKTEPASLDQEEPTRSDSSKLNLKRENSTGLLITPSVEKANWEAVQSKQKHGHKPQAKIETGRQKDFDGAQGSSKQRPARTIVVGGLSSVEMLDAVLAEGKKAGKIEAVQRHFSELELSSRGLAKDGCKPRAAAIVFLSVKAACQAVALLHRRTIGGGIVWARQLGGEGSKLKQLRLIVRNLPFQVTEASLRDLFSPAGFLWEVTIPRKPDGLSRGFAFVGFTSKMDADKAINLVNGKVIGKRPVAVDWAVAKKQFDAAATPGNSVPASDVNLDESESTASESELDGENDSDDDSASDVDIQEEPERPMRGCTVVKKNVECEEKTRMLKKRQPEGLILEEDRTKVGGQLDESDDGAKNQEHADVGEMDRLEEIHMVRMVLSKVVTSSHDQEVSNDEEILDALAMEHPVHKQLKASTATDQRAKKATLDEKKTDIVPKVEEGTEMAEHEKDSEQSKLSRTVFVRNLPVEAKVPELRKLFSEFGEIKSFRLVLHPITKSKGNAFLEYAIQDAAQAAVAAAGNKGEDQVRLVLKGRPVSVSMAVDKDSARKMAKETFHKQVEEDKRNLALAKEGQVLTGTPAAAGVSKRDMSKRQQLEHEKATKLRSPNFHVSRTRLSVHNFPKSMTEKELKKLFIDAVRSRASKQNPVIKQVKIMLDEDSQKSRSSAFVEFTEHQHALVALRVLNNNPATFGAEHRPIVEFAIENSLILRKRAANAAQAKKLQIRGIGKRKYSGDDLGQKGKKGGQMKKQKMRGCEEDFKSNNDDHAEKGGVEGEMGHLKDNRKRKRAKDGAEVRRISKGVQDMGAIFVKDNPGDGLHNHLLRNEGEQRTQKAVRKIKRGKTSGADRRAAQAGRASSGATKGPVEGAGSDGQAGTKFQPVHKGRKKSENPVLEGKLKYSGPHQSQIVNKRIRGEDSRQRNSRREDSHDKLDKLVAEYRTKYFSGISKPTASKGVGVASGDLRRWYE